MQTKCIFSIDLMLRLKEENVRVMTLLFHKYERKDLKMFVPCQSTKQKPELMEKSMLIYFYFHFTLLLFFF